jgi:Ca2+-binding RTX toxin-like protein
MIGGPGNDIYAIDDAGDVVVESANEGIDEIQVGFAWTLADNLENLTLTGKTAINGTGNAAANRLIGNAGTNLLVGLDGNDTLDGGAGADTLNGGSGNDTYVVDDVKDTLIELAGGGIDTVISSQAWTLAANFEHLTLTGNAALKAAGNELANLITGNDGNNSLTGGAGDDTLVGGAGNDSLVGGEGNDVYGVDNAKDVVTETTGQGTDVIQSSVTYTAPANVEYLTLTGTAAINATGNELANVLQGNAGNNVLDGKAGADTMMGGAGDDTYVVDNLGDIVLEGADEGFDIIQASVSMTLLPHVEGITLTGKDALSATGNIQANTLIGNAGNNVLTAYDGDDTLDGGAGNDTLIGGAGDDTYVIDNAKDVITETADGGIDTVQSTLAWTLADNLEHLTLLDKATNATGNAAANRLTGNAAANVLDGKAGADTMIGGTGNDTYYVDNVGDIVTELAGGGTDTVFTTLASWTLPAEVDNLTLAGSAAGNATGNALANTLTGNAAANVLDGGLGADTMIGGAGDDTYVVDNAKDTVTEAANAGTDAVQSSISWTLGKNLENLTLTGTAAINATGNELANVLQGNAGNNTLDGGLGNDTYLVGRGSGADLIKDNDTKAGNLDTLRFLEGIATDQLWFRKVGSNLEVSIIGTADKATIDGWYTNSKFRVEQFRTSAGKTLAMGKVDALVSAMAGLTPPAMGQTMLPANLQNLSGPIAAAWI